MTTNLTYQILSRHLVHGRLRPGEEIGVRADQLLTQDGTGTMVFLHLDKLGRDRALGRLAVCYVDHNTLGEGPENADDHRFLYQACQRYRVHYSRPGNGIGHQLHLARFGVPGGLLLGADSHVVTLGGLGMLAIGVGGLELAVALTGVPHFLICPSVTRVVLRGALPPWSSAKDAALTVIGRLAARANSGVALEYTGPGVKTLAVPERATIANLGAELGVTSSIFPADAVTRSYLVAQGRGRDFRRAEPPKRSDYADEISIDLSTVVPMVALPHSPLQVMPVREASAVGVDQVAIGSCTNGGFEDIAKAALVLRGKRIPNDLELVVAPATRQALQLLIDRGLLTDLLASGARLAESACGFCIGHGLAPASGWVSVRTSNRNYPGRCGTLESRVYLVSPETAAASALRGLLTDPRDLKRAPPRVAPVRRYPIDDGLIVAPPRKSRAKSRSEPPRGPNIIDPPLPEPLPNSLRGEVVLKLGDDISTDQILPAGRWLKYRSNVPAYALHTFAGIDPQFVQRALENKQREVANIIVAGERYGQGSSREHAAMCPMAVGVRVVLAKRFERIHHSNLVDHGIVPLVFLDARHYDMLQRDDYLELPWIAAELRKSETVTLRNPDRSVEFKAAHGLTRRQIDILLAGGLHRYVAARRPVAPA